MHEASLLHVVVAVQGATKFGGNELFLTANIRVAASDTVFGQAEVTRGVFPGGDATVRFVREAEWGQRDEPHVDRVGMERRRGQSASVWCKKLPLLGHRDRPKDRDRRVSGCGGDARLRSSGAGR